MYDAFELKSGINEPISHGWYPPHITVVDNTGDTWGTSRAIKDSDGVSAPPLYIFLWFYLTKKREKQGTLRYFDITANCDYGFNNFTIYL